MSPERLLQYFERISEAPDAIPRLRRFVLDLAVRGKLVEQDPEDGSAEELLKRVKFKKQELVRKGAIRKPKDVPEFSEAKGPFPLPASWAWVYLAQVGGIIGGGTPPSKDASCFAEPGTGIPWLTPADLGNQAGHTASHGTRDLTEDGLTRSSAQLMPKGTVLFTSRAPIGYVAIAENEISTNQGFKSVVPFISEMNHYIAVYFRAFGPWINERASGTTFKEVSGKTVSYLPFPLPPLAEQHRIVAKVDELMALCDELEAAQATREDRRDRLVAATLHGLNNGDTEPDSGTGLDFTESARFYLNHLPRLTTRPEHVHQLRQTILNLAVRGKLVEQDPEEGTGIELLEKVRALKATLMREKSIRRDKDIELSHPDTTNFAPSSWTWAYVGDVALVQGGKRLPRGVSFSKSPTPHIYIRVTDMKNGTIMRNDLHYITPEIQRLISRYTINKEDLYITIAGTIGEVGSVPAFFDGHNLTENAAKLVFRGLHADYFQLVLSSGFVQAQFHEKTKQMAQPKLALKRIAGALFPLPPLAEQHRIVAKVDELMALCDELETHLTTAATTRARLLDATLHEALNGAGDTAEAAMAD